MILAMLPWSAELAGQLHEHVIGSELLRGNPLGDPHERPLLVYTPPGYDDQPDRAYPVVYVIQGYTGQVTMWRNRTAFRQPFPEAADAMFARGAAPPAVVVYVDAWTAYGGSQFVDSPGTGRYHSYLCDEVVAYVDARYRTLPDAAHRAITGKSSGGWTGTRCAWCRGTPPPCAGCAASGSTQEPWTISTWTWEQRPSVPHWPTPGLMRT
jgi:enterochelin esterase-like enzyme